MRDTANILHLGREMLSNQTVSSDSTCLGFIYNPDIVPALYFMIFPLALLLNGVAAWISLKLKSNSTFIVYLKNLIGADVVLTLIIPLMAADNIKGISTVVKLIVCYVSPVFYSTQYTCIGLLGLISLARFFKIMMPRSRLLNENLTISRILAGSVWVVLFCSSALPNIFLTKKAENIADVTNCMVLKGPEGLEVHRTTVIYLNAFFWSVSVIMTICYACITNKVIQSFRNSGSNNNQGKKKIKLRVFLVVLVFFVFFGPYHIVRIPYTSLQISSSESSCLYLVLKFLKNLTLWFATANICANPLLYVFLCREFREEFVLILKRVSAFFKVTSSVRKVDS
ncbi:P2Y purinoceptor 13-like [Nelusetta ayraudi]|uniref:P2Y purinoceptor 13-like n=1 Tax=Nelusetta ayraudi TaxID=303726 RepID=UPI003F70BEF2